MTSKGRPLRRSERLHNKCCKHDFVNNEYLLHTIFDTLSMRQLLNVRSVCRQWRAVFDSKFKCKTCNQLLIECYICKQSICDCVEWIWWYAEEPQDWVGINKSRHRCCRSCIVEGLEIHTESIHQCCICSSWFWDDPVLCCLSCWKSKCSYCFAMDKTRPCSTSR